MFARSRILFVKTKLMITEKVLSNQTLVSDVQNINRETKHCLSYSGPSYSLQGEWYDVCKLQQYSKSKAINLLVLCNRKHMSLDVESLLGMFH